MFGEELFIKTVYSIAVKSKEGLLCPSLLRVSLVSSLRSLLSFEMDYTQVTSLGYCQRYCGAVARKESFCEYLVVGAGRPLCLKALFHVLLLFLT